MWKDLPRNTRMVLAVEPGSSVLACILMFYAALYMQGNGLSARQIGVVTTVGAAAGLVMQCVAAPVTNLLGRRRTLLVFSLLCWSIPLLLWAAARGMALFILAAVIFSVSRVTTVAWYCMATEEVHEERKADVFGLLFIISSVGGIATVFAGPVLDRFGLVPAMRVLYLCGFFVMTGMFVLRHMLLTETVAGQVWREKHGGRTFVATVRHGLGVVAECLRDRVFRRLTMAFVLFNFAAGMGFVQILFVNNVLELSVTQLSLLPPVAVVVNVLLFYLLVPRVRGAVVHRAMAWSLAAFAAGTGLLLLIPPRRLAPVLLVSAIGAAGAYLFQVFSNAALNNRMGRLHKADAYSAIQFLVALGTIPAGYLAGSTFAIRPALAIGITGAVALAAAAVICQGCGGQGAAVRSGTREYDHE
jgi:MFS family permease